MERVKGDDSHYYSTREEGQANLLSSRRRIIRTAEKTTYSYIDNKVLQRSSKFELWMHLSNYFLFYLVHM